MNENNEPQAWEEELRNIYSLCIEAPGKRLMFENYLLPFIRTLRQKDKERLKVLIEKELEKSKKTCDCRQSICLCDPGLKALYEALFNKYN